MDWRLGLNKKGKRKEPADHQHSFRWLPDMMDMPPQLGAKAHFLPYVARVGHSGTEVRKVI